MITERRPAATGASRLASMLERLGVEYVFGMPGSQNVALLDAMHRSRLRTIVGTHELAAGFMANGYARTTGRPGILFTIPGPGFTFALTALAEAHLDSVPMVHLVGAPATSPGSRFQLQAIDQQAMARPVSKAVLTVDDADGLATAVSEAYRLATAGEPGPVVVEIASRALSGDAGPMPAPASHPVPAAPTADELETVLARIAAAERILIYAGQGTSGDPAALQRLAERLGALVATTTSARGVIPERHPLVVPCDRDSRRLETLVERADLVLVLGVKFSHNGAHGFRLRLAPERLVHVDASEDVLDGHYPAELTIACDVPTLLHRLEPRIPARAPGTGWSAGALPALAQAGASALEPSIPEADPPVPAGFFAMLREALPDDAILVTDSGLHQDLARRHFPVMSPRGLIVPTGLQSMGFGLPAALGAKLAAPSRPVVALIGDGGLAMAGMELLTAVREHIPVTVIVFVDGHYGLIRQQQIQRFGRAPGSRIDVPELAQWSASLGVRHVRFDGMASMRDALATRGPVLLEVRLRDSLGFQMQRVRSLTREGVRTLLTPLQTLRSGDA